MTDIVRIVAKDECYMYVDANMGIREELYEYFSFRVPGFQFMPAYKRGKWDGWLRLYNRFNKTLYKGLARYVKRFCDERGYDLINPFEEEYVDVKKGYATELAKECGVPLTPHWYQQDYVEECIKYNRALSLSPTSSGKSLMIYLLHRHYWDKEAERMLLIVPTIGLVHQMASDFVSYGYTNDKIHKITGGADKSIDAPVVISTWQSIYKQDPAWFQKFGVVIVDEAHLATAKSLVGIMDNMTECKYRFGFTGTIDEESKTAKLTLEGLFGPVKRLITTKEMIEEGHAATVKIKGIVLDHSPEVKKVYKENLKLCTPGTAYQMEMDYIMGMQSRLKFIRNLVWALGDVNVIVMFNMIDYGEKLYEVLQKEGKVVHLVHGGTKGEVRDQLRHEVENDPIKRHIIVASSGVFSTGVSIKKLDALVLAQSRKSSIKTRQSIGRLLRKGNGADDTVVYDITDRLVTSGENYSLAHFLKRCEYYKEDKFKLSVQTLKM